MFIIYTQSKYSIKLAEEIQHKIKSMILVLKQVNIIFH